MSNEDTNYTQQQNIKFTVEVEEYNKLSFLVQVARNGTKLNTRVHHKPTHTDYYISFHYPRMVTGAMICMRDRANQICDSTFKESEIQHLQDAFCVNGLPEDLVNPFPQPPSEPPPPGTEPPKILCQPYVRGLSERLDRVCTPLGVKVAFTPMRTLVNVKTPIPEEKKKGVVY